MSDLRTRLDAFVVALLDEAEACDKPAVNDTDAAASEDSPASVVKRATLTDRVAVLKAATAWWNARDRKGDSSEPEETEEQPEIVRLTDELKRREAKRRR